MIRLHGVFDDDVTRVNASQLRYDINGTVLSITREISLNDYPIERDARELFLQIYFLGKRR